MFIHLLQVVICEESQCNDYTSDKMEKKNAEETQKTTGAGWTKTEGTDVSEQYKQYEKKVRVGC